MFVNGLQIQFCQEEEFEDTKGVIRICKSKEDLQHNGQKKKGLKKWQQSTKHTHKTKDRVTRTSLKTGGELMCSGKVSSSCAVVYKDGQSHICEMWKDIENMEESQVEWWKDMENAEEK